MITNYDLGKIKFSVDKAAWDKAVALYEAGRVTNFKKDAEGFTALVLGGSPYQVRVSARDYDYGDCSCYLGQKDNLCKHMIAVAIMAVIGGRKLTDQERELNDSIHCSGELGELSEVEIGKAKTAIREAMKYIKPYNGPSRIWFQYQDSLIEGSRRLSQILSCLPVGLSSTDLILDLLLRIDRKLTNSGVDDSDGTVGEFIEEAVKLLLEFAKLNPPCAKKFSKLADKETCFGWEEPLLKVAPV